MKSIIEAIIGVLTMLTLGVALSPIYKAIKIETIVKVHRGLHRSLTPFTQKLTHNRQSKR